MGTSVFIDLNRGEVFSGQLVGPAADNTAAPPFTFLGDLTSGYASSAVGTLSLVTAGTTRLSVNSTAATSTVPFYAPDGTAAAPSIAFASEPTTGFYRTLNTILWTVSGTRVGQFTNGTVDVLNDSGAFRLGASADVVLTRDAANTLAQKNGDTGQNFRVWGNVTSTRYLKLAHDGTQGIIGTIGTGSLFVETSGTDRWKWDVNGHFLAVTDNTYDIGASGATRPRTIYAGTSVVAPSYTVGASAGASGTGTVISSITVTNGIVTAISVA